MKKKLKINAGELVAAMESHDLEHAFFLDLETGDVIFWADPVLVGEMNDEIDLESGQYRKIDPIESHESFEIMADFVNTLPDSKVRRTADYPGQAPNVDLLFVPACHQVDVKLPAVSGSSGHLVIERIDDAGHEPDYPGKVFGNADLSYAEAMQAFAEASHPMFRQGLDKLDPPAQQPSGERKPEKVPEIPSQQAKIRRFRFRL